MMLAPVLVIMSFALAKRKSSANGEKAEKSKITIPWFAFGFILVIGLNSLLQACSFIPTEALHSGLKAITTLANFLLTMAMTALGAETSFDKFKQAGAKPFILAFVIYIWLLGGGYIMAKYLAPALA